LIFFLKQEHTTMRVERATVDDAEKILSLQKLAYQSEAEIYDDFTIPPLTQTLEEIKKDFESQIFLKAVTGGKNIGSVRAFMKEGTCYVGRLIVHPDFQNQGIGTQLMNRIEEVFKGAQRFEIFTGHKSERNLYLYEKLGYKRFKTVTASEKLTIIYLEKR
jgi:GNAT superfamily N-acetyltransferase